MAKAADLRKFQVKRGGLAPTPASESPELALEQKARYIKKGIQVTPEANQQFEILKAELGKSGQKLIAEALNLLFKEHGKPQMA